MLAHTTPGLSFAPGRRSYDDIDAFQESPTTSLVSMVQLLSLSADTAHFMFHLLNIFPSLRELRVWFPFSTGGGAYPKPFTSGAIECAAHLRLATISGELSFVVMSVLDCAPDLKYLRLDFPRESVMTKPHPKATRVSLCRLKLWAENQEPGIFPQVLASSLHSLRSLSIRVIFQHSFAVLQQRADTNLATALVHLDLMAHHYNKGCCGGCTHGLDLRETDVRQACGFIRACPRLAHLSLLGFHTADITAIIDAAETPLVSLAVLTRYCNKSATAIVRSLLESDHQALAHLRLLMLDHTRDDWIPVREMCQKRRTLLRYFGDLVPMLTRR